MEQNKIRFRYAINRVGISEGLIVSTAKFATEEQAIDAGMARGEKDFPNDVIEVTAIKKED